MSEVHSVIKSKIIIQQLAVKELTFTISTILHSMVFPYTSVQASGELNIRPPIVNYLFPVTRPYGKI